MNKRIILINNSGRLANQLWSAASVYAFCLESKLDYSNYPFFRYNSYFEHKIGALEKILSRLPLKIALVTLKIYSKILTIICKKKIVFDLEREFFLQPTHNNDSLQLEQLLKIKRKDKVVYFSGWLFRNPDGISKYYREIKRYFKPIDEIYTKVKKYIEEQRRGIDILVGVHIRQGDYKHWQGGKFYYRNEEVRDILRDFSDKTDKRVKFIICSDGEVDTQLFSDLDIGMGLGTEIEDLYTLAKTDLIIGSNSTYGSWAAFYGNIPLIKFSRKKINWKNCELLK